VVCVIVPALVSVPKSCSVARGASCGSKVRSRERMDERDIGEHMAGSQAKVAMEVPTGQGAVLKRVNITGAEGVLLKIYSRHNMTKAPRRLHSSELSLI
jgi:hypothetical protein